MNDESVELPAEAHKSPRRGMCSGILGLEAIALGLSAPVMIFLGDVDRTPALVLGLGLALACIVVAGMLRAEWAYGLGWAIQVGAICLGFLVPIMFFIGGLFALLWATGYFLGRRIEAERALAWERWAAEQQG
ncbi:DUF4233 domain-containing protein [Nocardioides alcanivorans]|uniref:DUF4233 domain-containing protein n=1 Tax=Nocardioides alcanivorans TaxID=2897352 RepID=UPI001F3BD133|nr:DUF4233 domain-containing protein [Nocardioides alcanivorans]